MEQLPSCLENLIYDYKNQLEHSEKYSKVMKELRRTIDYRIPDESEKGDNGNGILYSLSKGSNISIRNNIIYDYQDTDQFYVSKHFMYSTVITNIHEGYSYFDDEDNIVWKGLTVDIDKEYQYWDSFDMNPFCVYLNCSLKMQ